MASLFCGLISLLPFRKHWQLSTKSFSGRRQKRWEIVFSLRELTRSLKRVSNVDFRWIKGEDSSYCCCTASNVLIQVLHRTICTTTWREWHCKQIVWSGTIWKYFRICLTLATVGVKIDYHPSQESSCPGPSVANTMEKYRNCWHV